jgi:hypothetical protein
MSGICMVVERMVVEIHDDPDPPRTVVVVGSDAGALHYLMLAGTDGCTLLPGLPCSHYIWKLRCAGISIETRDEPSGGRRYVRYILRSVVRVVSVDRARVVLKKLTAEDVRALDEIIARHTQAADELVADEDGED